MGARWQIASGKRVETIIYLITVPQKYFFIVTVRVAFNVQPAALQVGIPWTIMPRVNETYALLTSRPVVEVIVGLLEEHKNIMSQHLVEHARVAASMSREIEF